MGWANKNHRFWRKIAMREAKSGGTHEIEAAT